MAKTWLVTGSNRGLGWSIVNAILDAGDRVVATSRDTDALQDLARAHDDRILVLQLDVTDRTRVTEVVEQALAHFGSLDVLVNNAGFSHIAPFEQYRVDTFDGVIDANFFGVVSLVRAVLPGMRQQRSGHIINVSSVGGRMTGPGQAAYHAAKYAVSGFSDALASEVAPLGIEVVSVEPGGIRTDCALFARTSGPELWPDYEAGVRPMLNLLEGYGGHEIGDPDRMAKVIFDLSRKSGLPRHLLLGTDALQGVRVAQAEEVRSMEEWAEVTASTDYPGSDLSRLAAMMERA